MRAKTHKFKSDKIDLDAVAQPLDHSIPVERHDAALRLALTDLGCSGIDDGALAEAIVARVSNFDYLRALVAAKTARGL